MVFSGYSVSSTTKTGRHDIAEILLKVALNTKNQIKSYFSQRYISLILVHPKFGFGMMNAEGMVNMAKMWRPIEAQQIYNTPLNTEVV